MGRANPTQLGKTGDVPTETPSDLALGQSESLLRIALERDRYRQALEGLRAEAEMVGDESWWVVTVIDRLLPLSTEQKEER
jgi:hypothetical protein